MFCSNNTLKKLNHSIYFFEYLFACALQFMVAFAKTCAKPNTLNWLFVVFTFLVKPVHLQSIVCQQWNHAETGQQFRIMFKSTIKRRGRGLISLIWLWYCMWHNCCCQTLLGLSLRKRSTRIALIVSNWKNGYWWPLCTTVVSSKASKHAKHVEPLPIWVTTAKGHFWFNFC